MANYGNCFCSCLIPQGFFPRCRRKVAKSEELSWMIYLSASFYLCATLSVPTAASLLKFWFSCAALLVTALGVSFISGDPDDLFIYMLSTLKCMLHSLTTSCIFCLPPASLPLLLPSDLLLHSKCHCWGHHLYKPLTALPSYTQHLSLSLTFPHGDALLT